MSHILYRWFNTDNELLYVGITNNALRRHKSHSKKEWFQNEKIGIVSHQYFDSRELLELAEREAIKNEKPKYNQVHNKENRKRNLNCTEQSFDFYLNWGLFTKHSWTGEYYVFRFAGLTIRRKKTKYTREQFLDICFEIAKNEFNFNERNGYARLQPN